MRFQNKSKPIKFSLVTGGKECRTVDEVKKNFDFNSLYENFSNGSLQKWLKQISETDLAREIEKIAGADILTRKIRLFNLFAPEKNVDGAIVVKLLEKGFIKFDEVKNSSFIDDLIVKLYALDYADNETINRWCETTGINYLSDVYQKKSFEIFNAKNARRLIDEQIVSDKATIAAIAMKNNLSDILENDRELKELSLQTTDNATINRWCENDLELLKYVYSQKSYTIFNAQNARRLIDEKIVTDENKIVDIATKYKFSDILERYKPDSITIKVGDTNIDMILVRGFSGGDFYIGKYPVTQAQWKAIMVINPSKFQGDDNPVESVSWDDFQVFIIGLNLKTSRKFRLPTEKEWEFAAKGGLRHHYILYSGSDNIDEVAWYANNSNGETHPVGKKKPNELGIYDMTGNVWEWCEDSIQGMKRTIRGGGWRSTENNCRISLRSGELPSKHSNFLGFRLALSM